MSLKVPAAAALKRLDEQIAEHTYTLHLYRNDYTPVAGSLAGDFTAANFSGYSGGVDITGWTAAATVGGRATSSGDAIEQTHNGGGTDNTIYGYFVLDDIGDLAWAERDPSPFLLNAAGLTYRVTPKLTYKTEF